MTEESTTLQIIPYPHPTLRRPSKPVRKIDESLKQIMLQMFDLMYEAKGVGLAANQIDIPLRFCVVNATGRRGEGEELVLINPVLDRPKGSVAHEEGCLSLPGLYGTVVRPKQVRLSAYDLQGNLIDRVLDGFLARVVQHEVDHLDGVLFIDRMTPEARKEFDPRIEELTVDFESRQRTGSVPPTTSLQNKMLEWEQRYG